MAETVAQANNKAVTFRGRPEREMARIGPKPRKPKLPKRLRVKALALHRKGRISDRAFKRVTGE